VSAREKTEGLNVKKTNENKRSYTVIFRVLKWTGYNRAVFISREE